MSKCSGFCHAASRRFYIDEVWYYITRSIIFKIICNAIAWFDRHIIDGFMNLLGWITNEVSDDTKDVQDGNVQSYAWIFIMGVIIITALTLYL